MLVGQCLDFNATININHFNPFQLSFLCTRINYYTFTLVYHRWDLQVVFLKKWWKTELSGILFIYCFSKVGSFYFVQFDIFLIWAFDFLLRKDIWNINMYNCWNCKMIATYILWLKVFQYTHNYTLVHTYRSCGDGSGDCGWGGGSKRYRFWIYLFIFLMTGESVITIIHMCTG